MNNTQQLRATGIFFFFCTCYAGLILNIFFLQIRQHAFYTHMAQKQYQTTIKHTPERALIYDRNHTPVALNRKAISAFICPRTINKPESLKQFLDVYFPDALRRWNNNPETPFLFVQRNVSAEQLSLIKQYAPDNIQVLQEPHRHYPFRSLASLVGITNIDNTGSLGIEYLFDTQLRGTPSSYLLQKDARSGYFYFQKEDQEIGNEGTPITLTVDADIQYLVHDALQDTVDRFQAQQGSVLVLNPDNGDIIVMANYPTFDPNDTQHVHMPHTKNYCITEQYELGSVIKIFAALAALQEQLTDIDEVIDCKNTKSTLLDGRRVNTTFAHGQLTFSQVIEKSNNIGIAIVARRLQEKLYDHYCRVGFGKKTNIPFPGEPHGYINPPLRWSKQSVISLSYGYEITCTLLQLARALSVLTNNGRMIQPRLITNNAPIKHSEILYDDQAIEAMRTILLRTTLHGTARRAHIQGYTILCKTGTTNTLQNGRYIDTKNSYTCAGIVEKGPYKRIIVTHIKQADSAGLYASQVAVPLFEKVAQKLVIHDKII